MTVTRRSPGSLAVDQGALLHCCERALRRARKEGRTVLLGFTHRVAGDVDPSSVVFASRAAGEDYAASSSPTATGRCWPRWRPSRG